MSNEINIDTEIAVAGKTSMQITVFINHMTDIMVLMKNRIMELEVENVKLKEEAK